jgi:hypothetical protein
VGSQDRGRRGVDVDDPPRSARLRLANIGAPSTSVTVCRTWAESGPKTPPPSARRQSITFAFSSEVLDTDTRVLASAMHTNEIDHCLSLRRRETMGRRRGQLW